MEHCCKRYVFPRRVVALAVTNTRATDGANKRGFTVVEMLVVVMILGILLAVSGALFSNAVSTAEAKECRANMQTVGNTNEQYKYKNGTNHVYLNTVSPSISWAAAQATLKAYGPCPGCPSGGTYSLAASGNLLVITCSTPGHVAYVHKTDAF